MKVGQLLCGGFEGTGVTSQAYHLIVEHHISTFILSKKNAVSVKQMTKLIRDLQYIAFSEGKYKYPLMFAIDEEGGMLNSLYDSDYLTQFPSAMALAAVNDTELVYEVSKALAIELKKIGFSIIFGPVLDVVTKLSHQLVGVRSFGTTVEEVVKNGRACARGFRDGGLFPFGKHFPGIGNASVDSLLELPMLADSLDQIKNFNAVPFAELSRSNELDGICAAGCGVPTISPDEIHACLSPVVINQLLRQDLGFDGVVISECLEMDALHHSIGLGQGVILALYAGCDLILVCHETKLQDEAVEAMEKALGNGNLDEDLVLKSLSRIETLQKRLPSWSELFPHGEESAKEELILFRDDEPDKWLEHKKLSQLAYRKSMTLVRDYPDALPITKFLTTKNKKVDTNNILILSPLLNPIYKSNNVPKLYTGEEVFQKFGNLLSDHPINKTLKHPYKVLHTTYTANGLTSLHESLIEQSKVVIVLTSEASRNMYQIGIVKYVSMLCGASPSSFNSSTYTQLSKPLILVATSSPYDFFYNKSIGSAYLCCYDYTDNALKELVGVIMGDHSPEGCIPGEKKYVNRAGKKRRLTDSNDGSPQKKSEAPLKRRWLVEGFDLNRDWDSLVTLIKNSNEDDLMSVASDDTFSIDKYGSINYHSDDYYQRLKILLSDPSQKHFVVRNSSLNILYGIILTWCNETNLLNNNGQLVKTGSIMYLLVDRTKRLQSIGKNLHNTAIRYLTKDQRCNVLTLGLSVPLMALPNDFSLLTSSKSSTFMGNFWDIQIKSKKFIMRLTGLDKWSVPKKIFRELMIVGVRFDICSDPEKLMELINKRTGTVNEDSTRSDANGSDSKDTIMNSDNEDDNDNDLGNSKKFPEMDIDEKIRIKSLYGEAIKHLNSAGVKIIIALEPTTQKIIGSIILFTNDSKLSKFYPFMSEANNQVNNLSPGEDAKIGAIVGPVIDKSYSNLTEIFKYGLICSGITLLKNSNEIINEVLMIGVDEGTSIKEIGFQDWKFYYDHYAKNELSDS
ncbi:hypothetical protein CLIB1444_01S03048 [[Candida] jaroonii]|uniref:Uncharacterized protein n=1 Tax=[Candida] jaroonii TaxID=467808 RepID=A0ACA9Y066_9ASCO|nr:hypothetical protein CLIB1444_01S03048 [[Candida] jaroonii]